MLDFLKKVFQVVVLSSVFFQCGEGVASGLIAQTLERGAGALAQLPSFKQYVLPNCFRPQKDFAQQVSAELQTAPRPLTRLCLQNKPLLFATQESIFDPTITRLFINNLPLELEILDLSMNRLPAEALSEFSILLKKPTFRFLDVRMNSGADSMDALHILNNSLIGQGEGSDGSARILAKVIWAYRESLDSLKAAGCLKERYYKAHQEYYKLFHEEDGLWELPD